MPFKRPPPARRTSSKSPSSRSSSEPPAKRLKPPSSSSSQVGSSHICTHVVKVHIVQAKLDAEDVAELFSLVEKSADESTLVLRMELCKDVRQADVIVTAVRMKQRLIRHIDWAVAETKAIVTPQWVHDSVQHGKAMPCGNYAALRDLRDETIQNCPDSDGSASMPSSSPTSPRSASTTATHVSNPLSSTNLSYSSRYACSRASPLICPNQALVVQLEVVRRSRELEGEGRSALSYSRAIAVLKAFPHTITRSDLPDELAKLPFLGTKLRAMVEEYLSTGQIKESYNIVDSSRFRALSSFASIYGIGPTTARRLHALGLRSIEDLERYYDGRQGLQSGSSLTENNLHSLESDCDDGGSQSEDLLTEMSIKLALALRGDFSQKIPRDEVEEMHRVVMHELYALQPGCSSTIVGGYRRGKLESNDVDIVITHPDIEGGEGRVKGLCARLVRRLYECGLVTHVMHLSGFHAHNALRTTHWDSLEKALTIFVLPPKDTQSGRVHRRLDLIFAAPEVYWTAVVGWTGSMMFERDLRLWAKEQKGLKFDSSGITRRRDSKHLYPKSEEEVFSMLGLEWVHPTMRNADA